MLPKKINDVLKTVSPRKLAGTSYHSSIRFNALRERSRSDSRHRSLSVKRALDFDTEQPQKPNNPHMQPTPHPPETYTIEINADKLESLKVKLVKVASVCDHLGSELENSPFSPEMKEILGGLLSAVLSLGAIQGGLLPTQPVSKPTFGGISYANAAAKNPHQEQAAKKPKKATQAQARPPPHVATQPQTGIENDSTDKNDQKYYKFCDVVKEAEKATLIFNLDLGKSPIMNQDTMSTRASLALSKMAAKKEKLSTSIPSEETRDTLDDALGMAKNITFYGKQTKTYRNPKDTENSGAFCTLPVRYDFKDRDTRARVENILREKCDIKCSTPYPLVIRECMKQAAERTKKTYPEASIRVNLDAKNFCLRIAKKGRDEPTFTYLRKHLPLPIEALDTTLKKLPENFTFDTDLTPTPPRQSRLERATQAGKDTENNQESQKQGSEDPPHNENSK